MSGILCLPRRDVRRVRSGPGGANSPVRRLRCVLASTYNQSFLPRARHATGRSFNGRTRGSGPRNRGSNPCLPASLRSRFGELRPGRRALRADVPRSEARSGEGRRAVARRSRAKADLHRESMIPQINWPETCLRFSPMKGIGRRFVYILRSESAPSRHYVGITEDLDERLRWHDEGPCG